MGITTLEICSMPRLTPARITAYTSAEKRTKYSTTCGESARKVEK